MADVSFSAGSDEECEILVGMVHDRLPREYAHQPIRIVESETSDENHSTTASEEESTAEEATENRLASVNTWCRCGMCESETLGDEKEAICCLEVPNCVKMIAAAISSVLWQLLFCWLRYSNSGDFKMVSAIVDDDTATTSASPRIHELRDLSVNLDIHP
ncbi:hypothetical protein CAPTEDRAFT_216477 [Capitella teleta]|uniref:Uncharacterized protein n=1 Tax=Capitella teleta TaxID=283909 RepID=R7TLG0_CAPTE|nr:hypothetical protein CAPTEDRAFT_216477 [Capitella teleta]|eukprot:ELT91945.1 hypothetical protein CAPTEDRAFT_216477 [Capitella teleta]